ncbi:MAG: DUF4954 family protein [Treponema sp.]|nr:DUF4954 family protein [Treponema sp.]
MPEVRYLNGKSMAGDVPKELLEGKRHLTAKEVYVLIQNRNISSDPDWQNVYVSAAPGEFNAEQIVQSEFSGWVVLGAVRPAMLRFHDLELKTGIYRSVLRDVLTGDDCVIHNVSYLSNYRIGNRVMLFNIQEMSCTSHSKFGSGILKQGEPESHRIWIGVGNENGERGVLPFPEMIPADAYLWSRYREDKELLNRFVELTEKDNDGLNNTYGIVEDDAVIKNCTLLKDARIGRCAYIKGAFKLKNINMLSSPDEPSQIGEGVELVNGIMGYGSHVFYQAVAVRFVIGRNCQLKYGARLLNSVLGDNSTVSCCELLNNLIFPFHEQHHNSSFLIASTVMGQSNIASAATIGSNHNSRSPDGEMLAGRGFWPGLCSDFKFDSRFASFVLAAKGSYQNELNVTYPFSLLAPASGGEGAVHIIPGYWFLYNMYAIVRNKYKFKARDKRFVKVQHIETDPLAPDSIQEVEGAVTRLIELTSRYLKLNDEAQQRMTETNPNPDILQLYKKKAQEAKSEEELFQTAKDYLHRNKESKFMVSDDRCQKKFGAVIYKTAQGYTEYRRILKYFAASSLISWTDENSHDELNHELLSQIMQIPLHTAWSNVGGQVIPNEKIRELFEKIKDRTIDSWEDVHAFYDKCQDEYVSFKARYAVHILEFLYSRPIQEFDAEVYRDIMEDVLYVSDRMLSSSFSSREKDYTDFFRSITFRNQDEMEAVLGTIKDSVFLKDLKTATTDFDDRLRKVFAGLM